jgi:hypothetical protein
MFQVVQRSDVLEALNGVCVTSSGVDGDRHSKLRSLQGRWGIRTTGRLVNLLLQYYWSAVNCTNVFVKSSIVFISLSCEPTTKEVSRCRQLRSRDVRAIALHSSRQPENFVYLRT